MLVQVDNLHNMMNLVGCLLIKRDQGRSRKKQRNYRGHKMNGISASTWEKWSCNACVST